jgi:hypothetical protein
MEVEIMLNIISLGAGVQSTTLALKAAIGEIKPMPVAAIFADTGWEPVAVYTHLEKLKKALPFPVYTVSAGNIRDDAIAKTNSTGQRFASIPWHMKMPNGDHSMGRRQCTAEYKLKPLYRKVRELLGGKTPKGGCNMWVGISTDEFQRMKPARVKYIVNSWPLIDAGLSRNDCIKWLNSNGWNAPKSSCIGCPFHSNTEWRALTQEEFADACVVDEAIRNPKNGIRGQQFVHRELIPLAQVDLRTAEQAGQMSMFDNECEGMCGV